MDGVLTILGPTGPRYRDGGDALWQNRSLIAEEVVGYIEAKWTVTVGGEGGTTYDKLTIPDTVKCQRDIKDFIIPAIIADLITGGNAAVNDVIDNYLDADQDILHVDEELLPMLDAIEFTKFLSTKAINHLLVQNGFPPDTNQGSVNIDDYYICQYTNLAPFTVHNTDADWDGVTNPPDPQGYDPNRSDGNRILDAADLIEKNKKQIAWEAVHTMLSLIHI